MPESMEALAEQNRRLVQHLKTDALVGYLAMEIWTGNIQPDRHPMFVTDYIEVDETVEEIQTRLAVDRAVIEQAIQELLGDYEAEDRPRFYGYHY